MDSNKISKLLRRHFYTHDYKLHNQYIFNWECDFFCISAGGYTVEVEIKISKSDFKANFKKLDKHRLLQDLTRNSKPNKFWYCCPAGIIDIKDIPAYAGLLWIDKNLNFIEVKKAPFIHKEKNKMTGILLSKYYNLNLSMFQKLLKFRSDFSYGLPDNKKQALDAFINKFHFD